MSTRTFFFGLMCLAMIFWTWIVKLDLIALKIAVSMLTTTIFVMVFVQELNFTRICESKAVKSTLEEVE